MGESTPCATLPAMSSLKQKLRSPFGSALLGGLVVAVLGWIAIAAGAIQSDGGTTTTVAAPLTAPVDAKSEDGSANVVNQIYKSDGEGVAFIESQLEPTETESFNPFGEVEPEAGGTATGSGFVIDDEGHILTNNHVVEGASKVTVKLGDSEKTYDAEVVGADPGTDIAVVRVEPRSLVDVRFGDSDALQVGDFVIAIGNPFGIGQTATSGIVSALGRSGLSMEGYEHFIQTDASINPGNSGGALVNLKGELVGINTAIIGPSGGNVGIGFAVPVVMAHAVMEQLVKFGEVKRGRLGISMTDVVGGEGATIAEVQADSPASKAGLRKGDVVTGFNGRPVRGAAELRARLGVVPVGDTVDLQVQRGGEQRTLRAQIGAIETRASGGQAVQELAGAVFQEVSKAGLPGRNRAVLVTAVKPESPAFRHGLRAGDLIVGVNARRVSSVKELTAALKIRGGAQINVLRGDNMLTIPVS